MTSALSWYGKMFFSSPLRTEAHIARVSLALVPRVRLSLTIRRNILPSVGNELIVNIKDSSVLNVISVSELFFQAKSAAGTYYKYFEVFFIIAVIYLVLTVTVSRVLRFVEKKMDGPDNYVICGSQSDSRSEIVVSKEQEEEVDRQWQSK